MTGAPPSTNPPVNGFVKCAWKPPGLNLGVGPNLNNFLVQSWSPPDNWRGGSGTDITFGLRVGRRGSTQGWLLESSRFTVPAQTCVTPGGLTPPPGCALDGQTVQNALWTIDFSLDLGGRDINRISKDHLIELRLRGGAFACANRSPCLAIAAFTAWLPGPHPTFVEVGMLPSLCSLTPFCSVVVGCSAIFPGYSKDVVLNQLAAYNLLLNPTIIFNKPLTLWQGAYTPNVLFNEILPDNSGPGFRAELPTTYYVTLAIVERSSGVDLFGVDTIVDVITPSSMQ